MTALLDGRAVLVTGGGRGLGAAIAHRLAAERARVTVMDVDGDAARRVAAEIDGLGCAGDVRSAADVSRAVETACVDGRLHALVLSAAVETRASVVDCADEDWRRVLDTDLKGPFLCMRAAIPPMIAAGGGSIVALGSVLGSIPAPGYAAYCTAKAGLVNLCKQAAIEHAADRVRVNVLSPSACEAGLFLEVSARAEDPEALRRTVADNIPMRRLGSVADVTDAALFLVSDMSAYTTGTVLPLDGGLAARRM